MKWATHIAWGVLTLRFFGLGLQEALGLSFLHTMVTDILGHRGLRRSRYHDVIAILAGAALTVAVGLSPLPGIALGLAHVVLDLVSPGKLAVSWWYNLPFLALPLVAMVALGL